MWQLITLCLLNIKCVHSEESFISAFQDGIDNAALHSINHWMEYTNSIPRFNDFTACHWMNIKYFSTGLIPIWSYCMERNENSSMECLQLGFNPIKSSAYRNVETEGLLPWSRRAGEFIKPIVVNITSLLHRTWTHVCWTYKSDTASNKIYYNGKLIETVHID